ncbi:acetyltransferase [Xylariaceae sp. FL0255]|nr:acetyltransferase [Xylariaceae sp. FL0255]
MSTPIFLIREAKESDGQFLADSFDSSVRHLATIGSIGQWGTELFSQRQNASNDKDEKVVRQALRYMSTGEGKPVCVYIAEVEIPSSAVKELPESVHTRTDNEGKFFLAVGTVRLSDDFMPDYVRAFLHQDKLKNELDGKKDYVWLEALITDFRTGSWRKGAGAALIRYSEEYCRRKSMSTLYVDSWAGNNGALVKYYEGQGFSVIDFFEGPKPDGSVWHGAIYKKKVIVEDRNERNLEY